MTPRELQIINTIYQLGGQASFGAISKKTGLSLEYSRELAKVLLRQRFLEQPTSRILVLTARGRSLVAERPATAAGTALLGLAEVASLVRRQTGLAPTLPPEPNFFSSRFMEEEPVAFIKHDLNKNQTIELESTRLIQAGIDGLMAIKSKRSQRKIK